MEYTGRVVRQLTLKEARDKREWTQEQLAVESGVAQGTISKIERGERPNPSNDTVKKLEEALRLKRGTLVFGHVMARTA
jgi:transcriptional regulator with XRE-family HTH domain